MRKKWVKKEVLDVLKDYLQSESILFRKIKIKEIFHGSIYFCPDGGVFRIEVEQDDREKIKLIIKKNSLVRRQKRINIIPLFLKHTQGEHQPDHNFKNWGILSKVVEGIQIPLFLDIKKEIVICKYAEGNALHKIIKSEKPDKILLAAEAIGKIIGNLHNIGYTHGDFGIFHIILDSENNKVTLIDCEKSTKKEFAEDFINDINSFAYDICFHLPNHLIKIFWDKFLNGYRKIYSSEKNDILPVIYSPSPQPFYKKMWYKFIVKMNEYFFYISYGRIHFMKRYFPWEKIKKHFYLMKMH